MPRRGHPSWNYVTNIAGEGVSLRSTLHVHSVGADSQLVGVQLSSESLWRSTRLIVNSAMTVIAGCGAGAVAVIT